MRMILVIQSRPKLKGSDIRQKQNDRRGVGLYSQTEMILRWKWNPRHVVQIMWRYGVIPEFLALIIPKNLF